MIDANDSLAEIVIAHPALCDVLRRHRLAYCYEGHRSIAEVCREAGIALGPFLEQLEAAKHLDQSTPRWDLRPIVELMEHLVEDHRQLRDELARLCDLATSMPLTTRRIDLIELVAVLESLQAEVEQHTDKEEQILFPLIRRGHGETALMPVQVMMQDHQDYATSLSQIQRLTHEPKTAGGSSVGWRALRRALESLEVDLTTHVHLENNILFPRALAG